MKKAPSVLSRRPGTEPHEEETPPTLDDTLVWGKDPLRLLRNSENTICYPL